MLHINYVDDVAYFLLLPFSFSVFPEVDGLVLKQTIFNFELNHIKYAVTLKVSISNVLPNSVTPSVVLRYFFKSHRTIQRAAYHNQSR